MNLSNFEKRFSELTISIFRSVLNVGNRFDSEYERLEESVKSKSETNDFNDAVKNVEGVLTPMVKDLREEAQDFISYIQANDGELIDGIYETVRINIKGLIETADDIDRYMKLINNQDPKTVADDWEKFESYANDTHDMIEWNKADFAYMGDIRYLVDNNRR